MNESWISKISKCSTFTIHKTVSVYQYTPRRSIIITPSTPLCADIREIVSSISAAVDSVVVAAILLYVGEMSYLDSMITTVVNRYYNL